MLTVIREIFPEGSDRSDLADSSSRGPDVPDPSAVPIKPAVSVLMIRDGATGLEVFVQHRVSTMDFAAGVVVFPGGRVDPIDEQTAASIAAPDPQSHQAAWKDSTIAEVADGWRILLATAVREVEEETGAVLDPAGLKPWANWVTPAGRPKRFDTYFYALSAGDLESAHHQTTEAHSSEWMSVAQILTDEAEERLKLMRPTLVLMRELDTFDTAAEVVGSARSIDPVRPEFPGKHG